jgi:demethylmenaquinone methyltransferase/2-methoxy-6-polyprenyl-1,4-benzoquinol methylase
VSTFVWMKALESAPERYDRGIRMLSGGRIESVYQLIAERTAAPGKRILDIGCGTGGVSLACARRGATVVGIDIDAGMLEVARAKPLPSPGHIEWIELGAAEIEDRFPERSFDAIVSCLVMSELSADEQDYTLSIALSRLVPGGRIVLADEVVPRRALGRVAYHLRRLPTVVATYALTQAVTHPVRDLADRVRVAGFVDVRETRMWSDAFLVVEAARPREAS